MMIGTAKVVRITSTGVARPIAHSAEIEWGGCISARVNLKASFLVATPRLALNALLFPGVPQRKSLSKPGKALEVDFEPILHSQIPTVLENLFTCASPDEKLLPLTRVFG